MGNMQSYLKLWAVVALWIVCGCTAEKDPARGQLMIALQTDMGIPKDVTAVHVQVLLRGEVQYDRKYTIAPGGDTKLPATIAVVAGEEPNPPVEVRVLGIRGEEVRVFSKAVTTIPRSRIATLHVPVQWLCDGQVLDLGEGTYDSSCEPDGKNERACRAGSCERVEVGSDDLPDYVPGEIFGGGTKPGDELGVCYSTETCLGQGFEVDPELDDCAVEVELEDEQELNLGLKMTEQSGDGICQAGGDCFIPLDESDLFGWSEVSRTPRDGGRSAVRARLPKAVCEKLTAGEIAAVVASTACQSKTSQYPTCGPWSSVEAPKNLEPTAPTGPVEQGGDGGAGGSGSEASTSAGAGGAAPSNGDPIAQGELEVVAPAGDDALPVGHTIQLTVRGGDAAEGEVAWSSDDEAIATVDEEGLVRGVSPGATRIVAVLGEETAAFEVVVERGAPEAVVLTAEETTVTVGALLAVDATAVYPDGEERLSGGVEWSSSEPQIATVSVSGQVIGVGEGEAEIIASFAGVQSDPLSITVHPARLLRIEVSESLDAAPQAGARQLVATGLYSDGTRRDLTEMVEWSSEDQGIVSVSETGLAVSHAVGTVSVTAELDGVSGSVPFEVVQESLGPVGGAGGTGAAGSPSGGMGPSGGGGAGAGGFAGGAGAGSAGVGGVDGGEGGVAYEAGATNGGAG